MDANGAKGKKPVVRLGYLAFDEYVAGTLKTAGATLGDLLERHKYGDWGFVNDDAEREYFDWAAANGRAVTSHFMVWVDGMAKSVFVTTEGRTTFIIMVPNP